MYYILAKNRSGKLFIDVITNDWYEHVAGCEPIDCTADEMVIYDDVGKKYLVGPQKSLQSKHIIRKISWVDVGKWDFDKGEPYLIDAKTVEKEALDSLIQEYKKRNVIT